MAKAKLFLPPRGLSSCIFAGVYRDTCGANLNDRDRINYFPSSPLVSMTFVRKGHLALLPMGKRGASFEFRQPLSTVSVQAPSDNPTASWSPGEVEAISVSFFPDAWMRLGGAEDFGAPPAALEAAMGVFDQSAEMDILWGRFCETLKPHWIQCREKAWQPVSTISDWAASLTRRAALSGRGRSLRSFERHLKRLSGQTKQMLEFYASFEHLHRISVLQGDDTAAEVATAAGYSDQSHMGRAVRRGTGFSPVYLNRAIETEEAFWCYRLLGQRF